MERKFLKKFTYTLQGCPLVQKFQKMQFHSTANAQKIQTRIFAWRAGQVHVL